MKKPSSKSPLAAYREEAGLTQTDLGEKLGVQPAAVCKWENGRVPAERVLEIERVTGVPRHALRPDIYPLEGEAA